MIIGVSGKKQSGKDTIGKIINYLTLNSKDENYEFIDYCEDLDFNERNIGKYQIHKFADALKDIICILTGCTRAQLEDEDFKNTYLPIEWKRSIVYCGSKMIGVYINKEEARKAIPELQNSEYGFYVIDELLTYRKLLTTIGTDLFRNQLHPNVWINTTMSKYKPMEVRWSEKDSVNILPNWIITDVRFENEVNAIKEKSGIIIRVNSPCKSCSGIGYHKLDCRPVEPISETALDNYDKFDYIIDNNGSIEELIEKVREILIKESIL